MTNLLHKQTTPTFPKGAYTAVVEKIDDEAFYCICRKCLEPVRCEHSKTEQHEQSICGNCAG